MSAPEDDRAHLFNFTHDKAGMTGHVDKAKVNKVSCARLFVASCPPWAVGPAVPTDNSVHGPLPLFSLWHESNINTLRFVCTRSDELLSRLLGGSCAPGHPRHEQRLGVLRTRVGPGRQDGRAHNCATGQGRGSRVRRCTAGGAGAAGGGARAVAGAEPLVRAAVRGGGHGRVLRGGGDPG